MINLPSDYAQAQAYDGSAGPKLTPRWSCLPDAHRYPRQEQERQRHVDC